jgi:hypothetical protein
MIGRQAGYINSDGRRRIRIDSVGFLANRLTWLYMTGIWPMGQIDHINGIRDDDRWDNLREVTNQQNCWNQGRAKNNTSGYKGVNWEKTFNSWSAHIGVHGRKIYLGSFKIKEDAARAYNEAVLKYFGEFAHTNILGKIMSDELMDEFLISYFNEEEQAEDLLNELFLERIEMKLVDRLADFFPVIIEEDDNDSKEKSSDQDNADDEASDSDESGDVKKKRRIGKATR